MIKYQLAFTFFLSSFMFSGCGDAARNEKQTVEEIVLPSKIQALDCEEIKQYPALFSYKTETLFKELRAKGKQLLTDAEKQYLFVKANDISMVFNNDYHVYPVGKIIYEKSSMVIYLVRYKNYDEYPNEGDSVILVLYDEEERPKAYLEWSLQDAFSTREINILSAVDFEIIDTDDEYSPDPESEARDIENGYEPETVITTSAYKIDTLKLQFELIQTSAAK